MKPSLRFLGLTVIGWAGFRAATMGALPGAEFFQIERSEAKAPDIIPTEFPPIDPVEPIGPAQEQAPMAAAYPQAALSVPIRPVVVPVYYASAPSAAANLTAVPLNYSLPGPRFDAPIPPLSQWSLGTIAAASMPPRSTVVVPGQSTPVALAAAKPPLDRLQLTSWALLRPYEGRVGPPSLATGGTLGGSQAGGRLTYNFTRQIAASFRTTTEAGGTGGEVAAGMRVQPVSGIPIWFTAERRQQLGNYGRNAFALFFEGGVYQRPMPWQFSLDAYLQGGIVGFKSRDGFIDGALTLTRPVYKQFSAGVGVWGGAQPGIYRVDAGPRVSMRVRNNVRVHFDWRQRIAGSAAPGSGPAVTLAADF